MTVLTAPVDPGLQPERTTMAWGRTSMAYVVCAMLMVRWAPHYGALVIVIAGALLLVSLWIVVTQQRRYRSAASGVAKERLGVSVGPVLALMLCTVVLGAAGMVFVAIDAF
ncbi:MAG TPA: DUF202 domain-containing protein [Candidatus Corynebacterium avicola]|uniref:DUF202 domain-containing protein n=1 Tax=Candidatus Corynebacterium avicola TaxID=2838527 RepID=A0A9D1RSN6_9CORY|nr:DUF202 domain-containing protein [Candidatus Corynebacterium avicola]